MGTSRSAQVLILFVAVVGLSGIVSPGNAQDSHYWTYTYGTKASLLSNAVIAGGLDLSATYYNPGSLCLIEDEKKLLASASVDWPHITVDNIAGTNWSFGYSELGSAPDVVAGTFKFGSRGENRLGYSLLTRQRVGLNIAGTSTVPRDVISAWPGKEDFAFDMRLSESLSETWAGLTWSRRFGKNLGLGITQYATFRFQSAEFLTTNEALGGDGALAMMTVGRKYDYSNYGILWKIGLALEYERLSLGFSVTTPSIKIYGSGATGVNIASVGWDYNDDGVIDTLMAANYQQDVSADYRTPLSIGIGAAYRLGNTNLFASAEWFGEIDKYDVMKTDGFTAQTTETWIPNGVTGKSESVINSGIGLEQTFTETFRGYLSFCTDYSCSPSRGEANVALTNWDLYHIAGGTIFNLANASWTLGLGYAWSPTTYLGEEEVVPPLTGNNIRIGSGKNAFKYRNYSFYFGFSF